MKILNSFNNINGQKFVRNYEKDEEYKQNGNYPHIELQVYYDEGGMNYFSGNAKPKGIYFSIKGCTISEGWKEYAIMGNGGYFLLFEQKRSNKKQYEKIMGVVLEEKNGEVSLIDHIADQFQMGKEITNYLEYLKIYITKKM